MASEASNVADAVATQDAVAAEAATGPATA
ncbi:MAG: hypothetical protein RL597_617, partial [Pseudomonadota bacterium]